MALGGLFMSLGKLIVWWALGKVRWRLVRLSIDLTFKYCLKSVKQDYKSTEYKHRELQDIRSTLRLLTNS